MAEEKLEHVFEARRANPPPRDMGPASISLRHAFARAEKDGRFLNVPSRSSVCPPLSIILVTALSILGLLHGGSDRDYLISFRLISHDTDIASVPLCTRTLSWSIIIGLQGRAAALRFVVTYLFVPSRTDSLPSTHPPSTILLHLLAFHVSTIYLLLSFSAVMLRYYQY